MYMTDTAFVRWLRLVFLAALAVSFGCGGGGGSDSPPTNPALTASFAADTESPAAGDVTLQPGGSAGATFSVDVMFTDIDDVFGATVNLGYDPDVLRFDGASFASTFMTGGGAGSAVLQAPSQDSSGTIRLFAGRVSPDPGVNVVGTEPMVRLTFTAVRRASSSALTLNGANVEVCSSQPDPDPACAANGEISVSSSGGTVNVN
jgi:hypothetical protein